MRFCVCSCRAHTCIRARKVSATWCTLISCRKAVVMLEVRLHLWTQIDDGVHSARPADKSMRVTCCCVLTQPWYKNTLLQLRVYPSIHLSTPISQQKPLISSTGKKSIYYTYSIYCMHSHLCIHLVFMFKLFSSKDRNWIVRSFSKETYPVLEG